jgi:TRAP-type C4-dicarboxylate transport system permease small subunit
VLVTRGHVRIDVLYGQLGPRVRAAFDLVAIVGLAILVLAIVDRAGEIFLDNLTGGNRSNTPLRIPLAWPQAPWFAGFVLFLAVTVLAFLRSLMALVRGDVGTVAATIGVPSQDEEVKGELGSLGIGSPDTAAKR